MTALSISRAWDETRSIMASDGRLFASLGLALFVVPGTLSTLVTPQAQPGSLPEPGWWTLVALIAMLIAVVGQLAAMRLALQPPTSVGEAIRHGLGRAPSLFGALLLFALPVTLLLGIMLGTIPALLPLFLLAVLPLAARLLLSSAVATAERKGPIAILQRSFALTSGHTFRLAGFLLAFLFVFGLLLAAIQFAAGGAILLLLGKAEPLTVAALLLALIGNLAESAVVMFLAVMVVRIYVQLAGGNVQLAGEDQAAIER